MYATDPACAHIQFGGEVCDIFTYFHLNSSVTNRLHNFMAALYIEFFLNFLPFGLIFAPYSFKNPIFFQIIQKYEVKYTLQLDLEVSQNEDINLCRQDLSWSSTIILSQISTLFLQLKIKSKQI